MKILPKSVWRPLVLIAIGAALIAYRYHRTRFPTRVHDRLGVLSPADRYHLNGVAAGIMNESGVDIRLILDSVRPTHDIAAMARSEARRLGMGRTAGGRGLLLLIDRPTGNLRLEVGPHLEGIFTDAFVGWLLREHVVTALADTALPQAIQSTYNILLYRLREQALGRDYDPHPRTAIADSTLLAMGGGATLTYAVDRPLRMMVAADTGLDRFLGPGPTPEAVLQKFSIWLSLPVFRPEVRMFTEDSRRFWAHEFTMTPGYWAFERYIELGKRFKVVTRGNRAIAYSTEDPLVQPHFFWRTKEGWQMDILAELINTRNLVGTTHAWTLVRSGDAYERTFGDLYEDWTFTTRFIDGANQALPWRGSWR